MIEAVNIIRLQEKYLNLLREHEDLILSKKVSATEIIKVIDKISLFWLNSLEIIELELESLATNYDCFMLSGSIFLHVDDAYAFKYLGDYHFIHDPFLKLDELFRAVSINNSQDIISLFQRTYNNTIKVLSDYNMSFFILPLNLLAMRDENERIALCEAWFFKFMSYMFNTKIESDKSFFDKYSSYSEIENGMILILKDFFSRDNNKCIEQDIGANIDEYCINTGIDIQLPESEKFFKIIYSIIMQVIDIILVSKVLHLYPSISNLNTFNYLMLVQYSFCDDEYIIVLIERVILSFVVYQTVNIDTFKTDSFHKYSKILADKKMLNYIEEKIKKDNVNIFESQFEVVDKIIVDSFNYYNV